MSGATKAAPAGGNNCSVKPSWHLDGDRQMLNAAKREHRDTSAAAQRALQVATTTLEVGSSTLAELHRQGEQLHNSQKGVEQIEQQAEEAGRIVRFMQRWFCFGSLGTSQAQAQSSGPEGEQQSPTASYAKKQQWLKGVAGKASTSSGGELPPELQPAGGRIGAWHARSAPPPVRIGYGLPTEDQAALQLDTDVQDDCIDKIGAALQALHAMSLGMQQELVEQAPALEQLVAGTDHAGAVVRTVTSNAQRMAEGRGRPSSSRKQGARLQAAAAVAPAALQVVPRVAHLAA